MGVSDPHAIPPGTCQFPQWRFGLSGGSENGTWHSSCVAFPRERRLGRRLIVSSVVSSRKCHPSHRQTDDMPRPVQGCEANMFISEIIQRDYGMVAGRISASVPTRSAQTTQPRFQDRRPTAMDAYLQFPPTGETAPATCVFCNANGEIQQHGDRYVVFCPQCAARGPLQPTKWDAVTCWNNAASSQRREHDPVGRVRQAEKMQAQKDRIRRVYRRWNDRPNQKPAN